MAKKKSGDEEEEAKGGGKKKIIIGVVLAVALFGAKTMLSKPPSPAEAAAAKVAAEQELDALCERQNTSHDEEADAKHESDSATTTTTVAAAAAEEIDPHTERGGVLELEPLTVNLADGHYLKIGIALQLDKVTLVETAKEEGLGAKALDMAIAALSPHTMDDLSKAKVREELKRGLGIDACQAYEGEVLTVYFTNFVMQ
jgi:flagellar basal body-associated protein FliL